MSDGDKIARDGWDHGRDLIGREGQTLDSHRGFISEARFHVLGRSLVTKVTSEGLISSHSASHSSRKRSPLYPLGNHPSKMPFVCSPQDSQSGSLKISTRSWLCPAGNLSITALQRNSHVELPGASATSFNVTSDPFLSCSLCSSPAICNLSHLMAQKLITKIQRHIQK